MRGNSDRFFIKEGLGQEFLLIEDKNLIKQWKKVLRLGGDDTVRLFDGSGWEYNYEIEKVKSQKSKVKSEGMYLKLVRKEYFEAGEGKLVLGFGLLKSKERMEWLLEKVTELGVDEIVPLIARYSQVDRLRGKERLEKKIVEACEQSGRVRVPGIQVSSIKLQVTSERRGQEEFQITNDKIRERSDFKVFIENDYSDYLKICWDGSGKRLDIKNLQEKIIKNNKKVLMVVGPEGGWSSDEIEFFNKNNFEILSFEGNVLRAETAGAMAVGLVRLMMND